MVMTKELSGIQIEIISHVYCFSKLDLYILDAPVSNRWIIKQGVSECLNISTLVELTSFVHSFDSWCIIVSLSSVIR